MELQAGQTVLNDQYRIERPIGRGAFGEVYLATHVKLNVPRAVKVLHRDAPGVGSTEFGNYRGRFQLEAQVGAHLDHRHVVRVYDFGESDGALYLVMAYCPGGSLKDRLVRDHEGRQRMPVEEAVRIAADVAHGLAAIHAQETVHRDLKPSNILFDADGRALVGDLGLAQVPGGSTRGTLLSMPAPEHPGTPEYMSPEQETTKARLRPPSDVYALGAVLFEMLTGQLYNMQRPGTRARSLRPDVPPWLDDLLARMLAPKPEDRPWDGAEVAKLLERGARPRQRKPALWLAAGLALVILVAAAWGVSRLLAQPPTAVTPTVTLTATLVQNAPVAASPTVTAEPTPAPTAPPAAAVPTTAPAPLAAPEPSATPRPVSTPTAAPTATPRPSATNTRVVATLAAPILESPADGVTFNGANADITLAWRAIKSTLGADEYYLITLDFKHEGQTWTDYVWTKQTRWTAKEHAYLLDQSADGRFTWNVRLMRAAAVPGDGKPAGAEVALSGVSPSRTFVWTKGSDGSAPAPGPATDTPPISTSVPTTYP